MKVSNGQTLCKPCHKFKTSVDMLMMRRPDIEQKVIDTWYMYL